MKCAFEYCHIEPRGLKGVDISAKHSWHSLMHSGPELQRKTHVVEYILFEVLLPQCMLNREEKSYFDTKVDKTDITG